MYGFLIWCCMWTFAGCDAFLPVGDSSTPSLIISEGEAGLEETSWIAKGDYMPLPFCPLSILVFGPQAEDGSYPAKGYDAEGMQTMSLEVRGTGETKVLYIGGEEKGRVICQPTTLKVVSSSLVPEVMEFERSL